MSDLHRARGAWMLSSRGTPPEAEAYISTLEAEVERWRGLADAHRNALALCADVAEERRKALQAMFACYEGVYDMAAPFPHRSEDAEQADDLARAALAGGGDKDE